MTSPSSRGAALPHEQRPVIDPAFATEHVVDLCDHALVHETRLAGRILVALTEALVHRETPGNVSDRSAAVAAAPELLVTRLESVTEMAPGLRAKRTC